MDIIDQIIEAERLFGHSPDDVAVDIPPDIQAEIESLGVGYEADL